MSLYDNRGVTDSIWSTRIRSLDRVIALFGKLCASLDFCAFSSASEFEEESIGICKDILLIVAAINEGLTS